MTVLLALFVLAVFAAGLTGLWFDFETAYEAAQHEAELDELWEGET